ncbi:MBL fold metallo-hydrolase [Sinomonas sp. ASV322]|uniref:MBL fold metallo-hydrolase n=1 Tax=Sinomonas sp. ASV322 TaxID=3041920 RepID=UPI0027DB7236|nr:MBL fold metallo-hydrolase [Sinomonas sp. ASV322]MDQ4504530.1 MBL fold metallo-hydrolase [Sinomonas sp. ASV322]
MESIYPSVYRLQHSAGSNGYVVLDGGRVAVIDPGLPFGADAVLRELRSAALLDKVTDVLVTHSDVDHIGAAPALQAATGARVWLGRDDAGLLDGTRRAATGFRRLLAFWPVSPFEHGLTLLDGGEEPFPGIKALATPGHTPGHMAFVFREVVFAGDAVLGTPRGFRQLPGFLTSDRDQALASERLIEGLGARWFCPGHGRLRELTSGVPRG